MRAIAAVLVWLSVLAACAGGRSGGPGDGGPSASTSTSAPAAPATSSTATPTAGSTASTRLDDGRHAVVITAVSPRERTITVDVVQLFFGGAASSAAAADGADEVPPPNDVWVRNVNPRLRTLPVAPGARITVNVHGAQVSGSSTTNVSRTLHQLARIPHLDEGLFWVSLRGGVVHRVAEQYLP